MKTILLGMLGALAMGVAFFAGTAWRGTHERPFARYQMQVESSGIVRLDRVTGKIHVFAPGANHDLPEER